MKQKGLKLEQDLTSIQSNENPNIIGTIKDIEVFLLPENYYNTITNFNKETPVITNDNIDILEQSIWDLSPSLLNLLLQDKTTGENIKWACDEYLKYGDEYAQEKTILPELIIKENTKIIQPRIAKSKAEQINRTRKSAEVFTPSWICNEMNNHVDDEWFGKKNIFNTPNGHDWIPNINPIVFEDNDDKKQGWMKYVDSKRLEITCGEAPYLVSRYDTTTGDFLPIQKRIGLLDRKLRVVNENIEDEEDWFKWAKRAFEATYGYEYQGDNLLLARENLLWTFIDNFYYKFKKQPLVSQIKQIANVIAWNIWQMDGLTDTVPFSQTEQIVPAPDFFTPETKIYVPTLCKIKDWRSEKTLYFQDLKGKKNEV